MEHRGPTFLIDDSPDDLALLVYALRRAGVTNLMAFDTPSEALRAIERGMRPCVAITDYQMPSMDGIEVAERIATASPGTEVIIHTDAPELVRERTMEHHVVAKGDPATLIRRVRDVAAKPQASHFGG